MASAPAGKRAGEEPNADNSDGSGGMARASAAQMANRKIAGKKGLRTPGRNRPTQPQGPSVPQQPLPQLGASSFGSGASLFPPPNPPSNIPTNAPTHPPNQQGFAFGVQSSSNSTGSVPVNSGFAFTMSQPQSSNSPFTIPQNSSFSFSGVPTMDFDKPAVINNHYASTEDTEVSSSKRQKSKDGNKYSPEEMKVRKELQELMRLKHKNGANGLQRYDPDYYEEMGTAELKSKATGEDVPLWAPGAPTLPTNESAQFQNSQQQAPQKYKFDQGFSAPVVQQHTDNQGYAIPAPPVPQPAAPKHVFDQGFAMPVAPAPQPAVQQHTFELGFAVPAAPAPAAQQQHLQANAIQTAPSPASAAAQDHEMTVDSPPQNGGNGNIGNLFTQAARQHVNLFGQSGATSTQPSLFAAPPMASSAPPPTFAATPVAFSAPAPSFSAPAASSPASSLFFPAPSTAASASAAPFSFSPAPVPAAPSVFSAPSVPASAPPALFSASSALFSALQKETPASAVASAASSVAAPVSTPPTPQPAAVPASLAAPASPVSAPLFPVVTPASPTVNSAPPAATPALPKATLVSQGTGLSSDVALIATPSNAGLFSHMLPAYSLRALEPQQYPSIFSEKQRYQFRMAFKLMSLEAGLQNHLDNHPGEELDSDRTDVYNKVQAMILDEAARVIPSTRKRTSDDNGQMNGYLGETKRQEISNHSYIPTKPANPPVNPLVNPAVNRPIDPLPATPLSSGNKKRKADEQITKDSYDPNGSVTIHETAKKGRSSTDEGVSYPKLPSPKSSNTPSRASNTAQLFQNLTSSVSAKEAPKPRSMGSSSSFQNKANTSVTSSQEDSLAATNTENTPAAAKNQSQFKVPTFAASSGQKPSFHFGTTSTNTTDKPTGSVPNFGESASDASQKAAFQVSNFGALSSSAKDKSAGPVPKSSESAGDVSQKPTFQVPKFGNPTNFLDAFSKKAATDEKKEKAKRKAKEFDSDEDDEENWERQDAEKQAAKKQKMAELVKDEFKFKMPTAPASGQKTAPPLFSISGSTVKSPTKSASVEKTVDTPAAGRSLFDRIENDTNGEPKREMPLSGETNSRSATTPSAQNIFGASTKAPSNIFGTFTGAPSNTSGASTSGPSKFSDVASSAPSNQKTPEKKRLGGFGTPNANPEAAKLFSALSGSPNAGDNTWKPETPIKFGASQAAPTPAMSSKQGSVLDSAVAANPFAEFDQKPTPAINITAATPTPATSSKQTSVFDSATKSKSFTGFGQDIFGSTPTTSSTTPSSKFGVGFNFGAPPTSTTPTTNPAIFNLAPSNNASAATSRGTTPDTGNATDEEALQDEQIDLASASKGEESEEIIFDCRARIQELNAETKKYETRAVGPLRLLKHKESGKCRLVGRIDASGRVVLNAGLMPSIKYEKVSKQVKFGALNLQGKLSTWVVLFKEAEKAEEFAKTCEENKSQ